MIDLENISLIFAPGYVQEKVAIKHLNLRITKGEFITVIGSNGAGKSTLLNLLAGAYAPTKGTILFDRVNVNSWPTPKRASLVSRVFQDPMIGTCSELTVLENLALAKCRGKKRNLGWAITRSDTCDFIKLLSELELGLENRLDTKVNSLSGGQRQALSLIMAILSPSQILLLDEYTSALDPHMAEKIISLTKKLVTQKGLTTLMVTHSLKQALEVGSRTIMMHNGQIIYDVKEPERKGLSPAYLLEKFAQAMDSDQILLERA